MVEQADHRLQVQQRAPSQYGRWTSTTSIPPGASSSLSRATPRALVRKPRPTTSVARIEPEGVPAFRGRLAPDLAQHGNAPGDQRGAQRLSLAAALRLAGPKDHRAAVRDQAGVMDVDGVERRAGRVGERQDLHPRLAQQRSERVVLRARAAEVGGGREPQRLPLARDALRGAKGFRAVRFTTTRRSGVTMLWLP